MTSVRLDRVAWSENGGRYPCRSSADARGDLRNTSGSGYRRKRKGDLKFLWVIGVSQTPVSGVAVGGRDRVGQVAPHRVQDMEVGPPVSLPLQDLKDRPASPPLIPRSHQGSVGGRRVGVDTGPRRTLSTFRGWGTAGVATPRGRGPSVPESTRGGQGVRDLLLFHRILASGSFL